MCARKFAEREKIGPHRKGDFLGRAVGLQMPKGGVAFGRARGFCACFYLAKI